MQKTVLMCKKFMNANRCRKHSGGNCTSCYAYDVVSVLFCDKCGREIDTYEEDYAEINHEDVCVDCMKKYEIKEEYVCHSAM